MKRKTKNARGMVKENVSVYPELVEGLRLTGVTEGSRQALQVASAFFQRQNVLALAMNFGIIYKFIAVRK